MPAELPPSSRYTYCVEFTADEAPAAGATVRFAQPVMFYVENFLGFPVGSDVPVGYYPDFADLGGDLKIFSAQLSEIQGDDP